jgi:LPXTG-site transpeptidase (sortase) family protein
MSDDKPRRKRPAARQQTPRQPTSRRSPAPAESSSDVLDENTLDETALAKRPKRGVRHRLYRIPIIGTIFYVLWPPRRAGGMWRRGVSTVLAVVAILGIGMAAYPWAGQSYPGFYRVPVEKLIEWSNFLSDLQTNRLQDQLAKEFANFSGTVKEGDPLTRIEIPKLGVDTIVVEGTSPSALKAGAGHYPSTPLPGAKGNVAIAGHRTTYGRPFNRVEQLKVGDKIILSTPDGKTYTYNVSRPPFITSPFDWTIVAKSNKPLLTLTTCHPKGSARQRLVVRAELEKTETSRPAV